MPAIVKPLKILQIAVHNFIDEVEPTLYAVAENGTLYFYTKFGEGWTWTAIDGPVGLIDVSQEEYLEWEQAERD